MRTHENTARKKREDGCAYCMYALVRFSQHVMSAQDTGSFLSMTFGSVLVQVKRNYDRYMQAQLRSIHESKVNRKSKCGILPFVANFEVGDVISILYLGNK
ncbi:Exocyst complex component 1 [Homalodisca vitripennis]|nr:Exocyst complex component 1 [Homalodisca vitripennis]